MSGGFDLGPSADDADPETNDDPEESNAAEQTETSVDEDESGHDQEDDPRETPAFPFSDDLRESWYVRDETMTEFEDAVDFETKQRLRENGVRNETGREIQDAAIQVATNHSEEIAEVILDERGVDQEDDE